MAKDHEGSNVSSQLPGPSEHDTEATFATFEAGQERRWLRSRPRIRWWSPSDSGLASDAPDSTSTAERHLTRH